MSTPEHIVGLANAIKALRAVLTDAIDRGARQGMHFQVQPLELTLQAVVTKDGHGKVGWGALGIDSSYQAATTQTLTLRLQPLWRIEDGSVVEDFSLADQTLVLQHSALKKPQPHSTVLDRPLVSGQR